jgi:acyl carrier protein
MNEQEFLDFFKRLLDTTEEIEMDTEFRYLDEWSSLTGLAFITDMGEKYGKTITPAEVKASETIEDLYNLYKSK